MQPLSPISVMVRIKTKTQELHEVDLSRQLGGLVKQNKRLKSDLVKQAAENKKKDTQIEKGNSLIKLCDTQIDNIIEKCEAISRAKIELVRARSQGKLNKNNE